jgi:peroxiredoxin Q/BCP
MKNFIGFAMVVLSLVVLSSVSHATSNLWEKEEDIEYGLPKGAIITHDLKGIEQNGRSVDFKRLSGENGMVLYFVRSAEWSRHCIFQLEEISKKGSIIEDTGYNIVVVTHDNQSKAKRFSDRFDFPYPVISDSDSEIIKAFGLLNTEYVKGTAYHGTAYPAVYIIGYDGLILHKFFHVDFRERPTLSEVRRTLDKIGDYESVLKQNEVQKSFVNE